MQKKKNQIVSNKGHEGFCLWNKLITVVCKCQEWTQPLAGDGVKGLLERGGRWLLSRKKSPNEFACPSSWQHLKLSLTFAFNKLCILQLCKSSSEIGIPRKFRDINQVIMLCEPAQLVISIGMGQVLSGSVFPTVFILQILNTTRGLIPLSCETDRDIFL